MNKKFYVILFAVLAFAMILSACGPEAAPAVEEAEEVVEEAEEAEEAEEVAAPRDETKVGVKVIDPQTLELTFLKPGLFNASVAGMWMGYAQPSWAIEELGDRWFEPGNIETYGPFTLKDWIHDYSATIIKNPFWAGTEYSPAPALDEVEFRFLDDIPALAEYEAGNLDVAAVPSEDMDRVKADPTLSAEYVQSGVFCSYYYGFNTQKPPMDDVRVRKAFSLAIDRAGLIDNVLKGAQTPARWVANPGLAGAPTMETHPEAGIGYDPEEAKAELQAYLDETGQTAADLDITLLHNESTGHALIAETIQAMWKDTLGVEVKIAAQEWKVYLELIDGPDAPQIFRLGWCLDYPDANNFTHELFALCGNSNACQEGEVYGGIQWFNQEYEDLMDQAAEETDNAVRQDLYAEAADLIYGTEAAVAPIYWYGRQTLTKPYVARTFSLSGHEYFDKWDTTKDPKAVSLALGYNDIPTLDPSKAEDTSSIQLDVLMFPGVTRANEITSVVEPAMADSWDVSDDGTVYTFHIKEGVPWVKYDEVLGEVVEVTDEEGAVRYVTADDFYYGFIRTLKKETGSPYAYVLDMTLVGAEDFHYADE